MEHPYCVDCARKLASQPKKGRRSVRAQDAASVTCSLCGAVSESVDISRLRRYTATDWKSEYGYYCQTCGVHAASLNDPAHAAGHQVMTTNDAVALLRGTAEAQLSSLEGKKVQLQKQLTVVESKRDLIDAREKELQEELVSGIAKLRELLAVKEKELEESVAKAAADRRAAISAEMRRIAQGLMIVGECVEACTQIVSLEDAASVMGIQMGVRNRVTTCENFELERQSTRRLEWLPALPLSVVASQLKHVRYNSLLGGAGGGNPFDSPDIPLPFGMGIPPGSNVFVLGAPGGPDVMNFMQSLQEQLGFMPGDADGPGVEGAGEGLSGSDEDDDDDDDDDE